EQWQDSGSGRLWNLLWANAEWNDLQCANADRPYEPVAKPDLAFAHRHVAGRAGVSKYSRYSSCRGKRVGHDVPFRFKPEASADPRGQCRDRAAINAQSGRLS